MGDKKKLLILVPSLQMGGQEKVAAKTAGILSKRYQITMLVFENTKQAFFPDCEIIDLHLPPGADFRGKVVQLVKRSWRVRQIKRKRNFDYAVSFGLLDGANLVNVLSKTKEKVVINLRAYIPQLFSRHAQLLYRYCDGIICCSVALQRLVADRFPALQNKVFTVCNPYHIDEIRSAAQEIVTDYSFIGKTIISHGRLDPIKNYQQLIRAFSIVYQACGAARLILIGEGEDRYALEKLIEELQLSEVVSILGFRKNPYKYLARSELFVLSSLSEGFPNSLVEAMIFLPVVATDCPTGPREILEKHFNQEVASQVTEMDYGVLIPPSTGERTDAEDVQRMAEAILRMLEQPERRLDFQRKACARVEDFSYQAYLKNFCLALGDVQE